MFTVHNPGAGYGMHTVGLKPAFSINVEESSSSKPITLSKDQIYQQIDEYLEDEQQTLTVEYDKSSMSRYSYYNPDALARSAIKNIEECYRFIKQHCSEEEKREFLLYCKVFHPNIRFNFQKDISELTEGLNSDFTYVVTSGSEHQIFRDLRIKPISSMDSFRGDLEKKRKEELAESLICIPEAVPEEADETTQNIIAENYFLRAYRIFELQGATNLEKLYLLKYLQHAKLVSPLREMASQLEIELLTESKDGQLSSRLIEQKIKVIMNPQTLRKPKSLEEYVEALTIKIWGGKSDLAKGRHHAGISRKKL